MTQPVGKVSRAIYANHSESQCGESESTKKWEESVISRGKKNPNRIRNHVIKI